MCTRKRDVLQEGKTDPVSKSQPWLRDVWVQSPHSSGLFSVLVLTRSFSSTARVPQHWVPHLQVSQHLSSVAWCPQWNQHPGGGYIGLLQNPYGARKLACERLLQGVPFRNRVFKQHYLSPLCAWALQPQSLSWNSESDFSFRNQRGDSSTLSDTFLVSTFIQDIRGHFPFLLP